MSFVPTDISDLWAWYDAAEGVTGGTSVTAWADQSGNSHNLTAASGQEPELISSAINSLPAISSYGLGAKMSTAANFPDMSAGGTVFLVAKQSTTNGATNFDAGGVFIGAGSRVNMSIERDGSTTVQGGIRATAALDCTTTVPEDTFVTIRLKHNGTTNAIAVNDGTENTSTPGASSYLATPMQLFKTIAGAQGNKQIAEVLIYTKALSSLEIAQVESYLQTKYAHY